MQRTAAHRERGSCRLRGTLANCVKNAREILRKREKKNKNSKRKRRKNNRSQAKCRHITQNAIVAHPQTELLMVYLPLSLSRTSFFLTFFMRIFAFSLRFFLFYFYFFMARALENAILATFTIGIALQDYATLE